MIVYGNEISSDYIRYSSGEIKKFNSIIIDYESVVDWCSKLFNEFHINLNFIQGDTDIREYK